MMKYSTCKKNGDSVPAWLERDVRIIHTPKHSLMSSSEDCWKYAWVNNLLGHLTREFVVNIVGCRGDGVGGEENAFRYVIRISKKELFIENNHKQKNMRRNRISFIQSWFLV